VVNVRKIINPNLNEFERFVLFEKGTEPPFSGEYTDPVSYTHLTLPTTPYV